MRIGVLGARSPVGEAVVDGLVGSATVLRFSRGAQAPDDHGDWHYLGAADVAPVATVVSLMPVWALQEHHAWLERLGCRRLVALSSTSRFTKASSARPADRALSDRLASGEDATMTWARRAGVSATVIRPTMIYGHPQDGNIASMRRVLHRFRVFPVVGAARGLRQPVHVDDVAWAAVQLALAEPEGFASAYTVSGGEVLTYREMVDRVRDTVPGPTMVMRVPAALFAVAERLAPRSRVVHTAAGMADRMASDMVFDHLAATTDFGYRPRGFAPAES